MENNNDILDDLLKKLSNENPPKIDNEDDFINSIMDNILDKKTKNQGLIIALRIVTSVAAVLLVGLFLSLNTEQHSSSIVNYDNNNYKNIHIKFNSETSTQEQYKCYMSNLNSRINRLKSINNLK
ncbi:MAG: hypothetical protein MJ211_08090 [Bacteroidales bacterium]|nr:hypothetical protein [Bacteroidales bacterium]